MANQKGVDLLWFGCLISIGFLYYAAVDKNSPLIFIPPKPSSSSSNAYSLPKNEWQEFREKHLQMVMKAIEDTYLNNDTVYQSKFVVAHCGFPPGWPCYDEHFIALGKNWFPKEKTGCRYRDAKCKGLGDRNRGLVTAFYLAIATHRRFIINWLWPSDLTKYFDTPGHLFSPLQQKPTELNSLYGLKSWIFNEDYASEEEFSAPLGDVNFETKYGQKDYIGIMSNRFAGLDNVMTNEAFRPHLGPIISQLPGSDYVIHNVSRSQNEILITAALRTIFRKPNQRLMQIVDAIIDKTVGRERWRTTLKIGVQIRAAKIANDDPNKRVDISQQGRCFGREIDKLLYHRFHSNVSFITFLTADFTENAIEVLRNGSVYYLENAPIITSEMVFPNLTVSHIERPIYDKNDSADEVWFKTAKTYVDWILLTQMDLLVISRSGFGESAAQFSMAPTRRFEHWGNAGECNFKDYFAENAFTTLQSAEGPIYDMIK